MKQLCQIGESSTNKDNVIQKIKEEITNGHLNQLIDEIIEKQKEDILIDENNIIYQITSTYNQNNKEYINISTINLGKCEERLRTTYNISNNSSLLIFKVDVKEEGLLIPIIEYEVYNSENKKKLELDICKDLKINITIPIENIDENNLYKYNISSDYYNDICFSYTTDFNTDITLSDRKKEFNDYNMSVCEKNCEFIGYNNTKKKVTCQCYIKNEFLSVNEILKNKGQIIQKFLEFKRIMNIIIIKCYKKVFCKEGLINNIGSYILLIIIFLTIILAIAFVVKGYENFKNKVNSIINNIVNNVKQKKNSNLKSNKLIKSKIKTSINKNKKIYK